MLRVPSPESLLLKALSGRPTTPSPIWLMRQAGRYLPEYREIRKQAHSVLDLCRTPKLAAEITLQPLRRFDLDAAIVFSDILIVPHALGQEVEFVEGNGPKLEPIEDARKLARLNTRRAVEAFAPVYETAERVVAELPKDIPLIGFCGAPWTVATYMVEGQGSKNQIAARLMAYRDPGTFQRLIDLLVESSADYLAGQVEAGARVLQIFDRWAGSLPEDEFTRWCITPTKRLIEQVKARHPEVPIIGFPRGAGVLAERYARGTGIDAIGCDTSMPVGWMRRLQERLPVQGNLDPILLAAGGTELDIRVDALLETLAAQPFIFNLGHGILPDTPVEHVARLVNLVKGRSA